MRYQLETVISSDGHNFETINEFGGITRYRVPHRLQLEEDMVLRIYSSRRFALHTAWSDDENINEEVLTDY
jgi:hypothetical protein